jgi:Family of unknown function (DUF6177)
VSTADDVLAGSVRHPLVDDIGVNWIRTESRSRVIHLSQGRSDLFAQAVAHELRVILVTDELSSITEPYRQAMSDYGGAWVVRSTDGMLRDGLTGVFLRSIEAVLEPHPATDIDSVSVSFLRPQSVDQLEIVATVSLRHKALASTRLGAAMEVLSGGLRGEAPSAWGTHEPTNLPWDPAALSAWARSRMPDDASAVVTGRPGLPMIATITTARTTHGLEETTRAFIGMGAPGSERIRELQPALRRTLLQLDGRGMPLIAVVLARPTDSRQLRAPVLPVPPIPLALLIGPPGVKALGLDSERYVRDFGAVVVGRPRIPGLLFMLGDLDGGGWEQLETLLDSVDPARLAAAFDANADLLRGLDTRKDARG